MSETGCVVTYLLRRFGHLLPLSCSHCPPFLLPLLPPLLQNINSWAAVADSASKCKSLQKLILKDCTFQEGGEGGIRDEWQ